MWLSQLALGRLRAALDVIEPLRARVQVPGLRAGLECMALSREFEGLARD